MLVSDFDYDLPDERIAKFPPSVRGTTRMLVLNKKTGEYLDSYYRHLDQYLNPGDVLILNDTRVIKSRLFCTLPDGRERELMVLEKHHRDANRVLYKGKLHPGDELTVMNVNIPAASVSSTIATPVSTDVKIRITKILGAGIAEASSDYPLYTLAEQYGHVPLPPYLHRDADRDDEQRYQTVWAKHAGSVAAPTASLNLTDDLLARLRAKGVIIKYLTLHVGLGTFLPIRTDRVEEHQMHSEWFQIPDDTLAAIQSVKAEQQRLAALHQANHPTDAIANRASISTPPRVVAVGTTVARTLEYYAKTGQATGEDDIFIYPGFHFQIVDALLTNFHAPRSTVLMLTSAFAGWEHLQAAYQHCVDAKYNFLSYGDSMFIC